MRVAIYETVDVSDEERANIAKLLGKKSVTREELKEYVWNFGAGWKMAVVHGVVPGGPGDAFTDNGVDENYDDEVSLADLL